MVKSYASAEYSAAQKVPADELVRQYAPLVRRIAFHLRGRLPNSIDTSDLIQAGMIGLLEASKHYAPGREASFETFAGIRIRGAMIDELRKTDWTPRSVHRKIREMASAIQQIEHETGADASDQAIIERMGIDAAEYAKLLVDATSTRVLSLNMSRDDGDGEELQIPDEPDAEPVRQLESQRMLSDLGEAIEGLPQREKLVMSLYYDEELNLKEVGEVLGVSESRVCQIHGKALIRLRARLAEWRQ
ncbi:RNA polymerase sigma factor FliA [Frateuria aurantia]